MDLSTFEDRFTIRSYEVDKNATVTLPQIANYFQEAAGKHADKLEFDISHLQEKGLTWVLYRMHIKIDQFPRRWEDVAVQTWPSSGDGIRAFRDYELRNSEGNRIGVGVSQWMVLDTQKRRPVRMPKEILEMGLDVENHLLSVEKSTFPKMESVDYKSNVTVGRQDLDMNNHANNVKYIEWMISYLPENASSHGKCSSINLQYHAECGLGDEIRIETQNLSPGKFLHRITKNSGETLLAEGFSEWE